MIVARTPRPPIVAPKPSERRLAANEIERWVTLWRGDPPGAP